MDVHFISDKGIEQHPVGELEQLLARDDGLVWVDIPVCSAAATDAHPSVSCMSAAADRVPGRTHLTADGDARWSWGC